MGKALRIFLIGLPGSGKSTLAKQVSERLNIPHFDLDDEIEKSSGKKVGEIFEAGEVAFRKIESATLNNFIQQYDKLILATGGGAPCFNDNLGTMKQSGTVIFLDVPVDEICSRISKQSINRPLLAGADLNLKITSLRNQRITFYNQAHFVVSGANIQASEIIDLLV